MAGNTTTAGGRVLRERLKNRRLPTIEIPNVEQDELARALQGIQEHLRMYEGDSGAPKERFITLAELENAGLVKSDTKGGLAFISQVLAKDVSQKAGSTANPTLTEPVSKDTSRTAMTPSGGSATQTAVASSSKINDSQDVNVANPAKGDFLYYNGSAFTNWALHKKDGRWLASHQYDKPIILTEAAAGPSALEGLGYLWVKDDAPSSLWFTADDGTETEISAGGAYATWTATTNADNWGLQNLYFLDLENSSNDGNAKSTANATSLDTVFSGNLVDWNVSGTIARFDVGNYNFDVDQTVGAGQDNYVLTYDNAGGQISLEAAAGGASQLTDLSDVSAATATTGHALMGNGSTFASRALVEADISNLTHTTRFAVTDITGQTATTTVANTDELIMSDGGVLRKVDVVDIAQHIGLGDNYPTGGGTYFYCHRSSASSPALYARQSGAGPIARFFKEATAGSTSATDNMVEILNDGGIDADGTVTGDLGSDRRIKNQIKPIKNALDKLSALNGVSFHLNNPVNERHEGLQYGFIAQDMQKVMPELVKAGDDDMLKIRHRGFEVQALIVEAIKELNDKVDVILDHIIEQEN